MPGRTPPRCRASDRFSRRYLAERLANIRGSHPLEQGGGDDGLFVQGPADFPGCLSRIGGLGNGPADDDVTGPGCHGLPGSTRVNTAGHSHGNRDGLANLTQNLKGVPAGHLFVNGHMNSNVVRSQSFNLDSPGHRIGDANKVHHDFGAVILARLDALGNCGIAGCTQDVHQISSGFGRTFHFDTAGIHDLHVGHDGVLGKAAPQFPDRVQAFAFNERCAGFQPVDAGRNRQLRYGQRPGDIYKIQGKL